MSTGSANVTGHFLRKDAIFRYFIDFDFKFELLFGNSKKMNMFGIKVCSVAD